MPFPELAHIQAMICPERLIATGTQYAVYDGPEDKYVIRCRIIQKSPTSHEFTVAQPRHEADELVNLSKQQFNYGQAVAMYGDGVTINYRKNGRSLYAKQFPFDSPVAHFSNDPVDLISILAETADLPLAGYENILDEMTQFTTNHMCVDFNPGNILLDNRNQQLGLIDPLPDDPDLTPAQVNTVDSLLRILTHSYISHHDLLGDENQRTEIARLQKKITQNLLQAAVTSKCEFSSCFYTLSNVLKAVSCSIAETEKFMDMARREPTPPPLRAPLIAAALKA